MKRYILILLVVTMTLCCLMFMAKSKDVEDQPVSMSKVEEYPHASHGAEDEPAVAEVKFPLTVEKLDDEAPSAPRNLIADKELALEQDDVITKLNDESVNSDEREQLFARVQELNDLRSKELLAELSDVEAELDKLLKQHEERLAVFGVKKK